jgi:hypothetical protein
MRETGRQQASLGKYFTFRNRPFGGGIVSVENCMRYRVTFMERTDGKGNPSEKPPDYVEIDLAPGVVIDRTFVERDEPVAEHVEEQLEEDDSFLSVGSETWDYEVADGRKDEFLDALRNSKMAIECVSLDDEPAVP